MMDCTREIEFHDDNSRALEKAKESILLLKKKMLRSHDLIIQYNNKLKECDKLKSDLCIAQEEVVKLKRENSLNLSKVVKLEMQSTDHKKIRQQLEQKIAEQDIQIASDRAHLQQLKCKVETAEDQYAEKMIAAELTRSTQEAKVKELEQELKAMKKSHLADINKLEKALKSPKKNKAAKNIEVIKEMKDIGVNTIKEVEMMEPVKPKTADKAILSNQFYHIQDNPYPLFCDRCETFIEPKIEKICKVMSHPPLVTNMLSPVRPHDKPRSNYNNSNNLKPCRFNANRFNDSHRNDSAKPEINLCNTNQLESKCLEFDSIDTISRSIVTPLAPQPTVISAMQQIPAPSVVEITPELKDLRKKIAHLERKMKKKRKENTLDAPTTGNCCSHQHQPNFCGLSTTIGSSVPNGYPNMPVDLMMEFFNRMVKFNSEQKHQQKATKIDSRLRKQALRDKKAKAKLRKLKKLKMLKKSKISGSSKWEVESNECEDIEDKPERNTPSDLIRPYSLLIKKREDSPPKWLNETETEAFSPRQISTDESFAKDDADTNEETDKPNRTESHSHQEIAVKVPMKQNVSTQGRKRGRASLFVDDDESDTGVQTAKTEIKEDSQSNHSGDLMSTAMLPNRSLEDEENETKRPSDEKNFSERENETNFDCSEVSKYSEPISPNVDTENSNYEYSNNSEINESVPNFNEPEDCGLSSSKSAVASDSEESEAPLVSDSWSEPTDCVNLPNGESQKQEETLSPKMRQRSSRSKLLRKLKALKKSSVALAANKTSSSMIHRTRSLSKRKLTDPSENEDSMEEAKESKAVTPTSPDEPNSYLPVKKQRIAHVPKKDATPQPNNIPICSKTTKSSDPSNEIWENGEDKPTGDALKRPMTRRMAIETLARSKVKKELESKKCLGVEATSLPSAVTKISRRGRPPIKRNAPLAQLSLSTNEEIAEKAAETSTVSALTNIIKDSTSSLEGIGGNDTLRCLSQENSSFVTTDLTRAAECSVMHSNEVMGEVKREASVVCTSPAEQTSDSTMEECLASPAASVASLDEAPVKPIKPENSMSQSSDATMIVDRESKEMSCPKDSIPTDTTCSVSTGAGSFTDTSTVKSEIPITRNLLVYDSNLYDDLQDEHEIFESRDSSDPNLSANASAIAKKKALETCSSSVEPTSVVKELRSRQVRSCSSQSPYRNKKAQVAENGEDKDIVLHDEWCDQRGGNTNDLSVKSFLHRHLRERKKKSTTKAAKLRKASAIKLQEDAEKKAKEELARFVESEEWTMELHQSVVTELLGIDSQRTVAKAIVDFLAERATVGEPLDSSYTPPAPVMTKTQQRIVTLITCLAREEAMSRIFELVQSGIEYAVFKPGVTVSVEVVEYLIRIFTVCSRIKKDRERVRIMCCDAFYCLGRRAIAAMHVVFTIWPEVLPMHGTVKSELPNCIAHMIKAEQTGKDSYSKVLPLKKMITSYYEYPQTQALSAVIMTVLLKALHENYSNDLETAIILISKREGTKWALDNVIEKGLLKIIKDDAYPWKYEALSLLGECSDHTKNLKIWSKIFFSLI